MARKLGKPVQLALFFWKDILQNETDFWSAENYTHRMRLLGQCKRMLSDGKMDLERIKRGLLLMIENAVMPKSPCSVYLMTEETTGLSFYDLADRENIMKLAPPVYSTLELREFLRKFDPDSPLLVQI